MLVRRIIFAAIVAATAIGLTAQLAAVLAAGGWTPAGVLLLLCFAGTAPWTGICLGNALPGFLVRLLSARPARHVLPTAGDIDTAPITARVAIAVTIRHEDMALVLPPLGRLMDGLGPGFALHILSDTSDPACAAAEDAAVAGFRHPARLRRRTDNAGYKAGNVMDFLDHHAGDAELVVMLDADSQMTPDAVRRLVRIMQADLAMGIVQHLTVGQPADTWFPRLFQFGMRAGMRIWATGQAWWQGPDGPYWGHNAILRAAAFRAHCRLETLPGGRSILSHDQVEAARMRHAGYKVCVWAEEAGSMEANPPALPEFLHRDARWLAGNLQYRHLLFLPGFRAMGRWQLVQAILMFLGAPLYTAVLVLAAALAATGAAVPRGELAMLLVAWMLALYAPKLLGYVEVLVSRRRGAPYGGRALFAAGAAVEFVFTLAVDAISQPHKSWAMARLALGLRPGWAAQNRSARSVGWAEAARLFWPHTLFGVAVFAAFVHRSTEAALWALPFAGGLLVAIPLCVFSARPTRAPLAATPEERLG